MNKIAATLFAVLALTACGTQTPATTATPAPVVTVTETPTPEASTPIPDETPDVGARASLYSAHLSTIGSNIEDFQSAANDGDFETAADELDSLQAKAIVGLGFEQLGVAEFDREWKLAMTDLARGSELGAISIRVMDPVGMNRAAKYIGSAGTHLDRAGTALQNIQGA